VVLMVVEGRIVVELNDIRFRATSLYTKRWHPCAVMIFSIKIRPSHGFREICLCQLA
jgi:hypothetical protein